MSVFLSLAMVAASALPAAPGPLSMTTGHSQRVRQTAERPRPPGSAAPTLRLPARDAAGSFITPNVQQEGASAFWHVRIALNVAALGCRGEHEAAALNGFRVLVERHGHAVRHSESHVIDALGRHGGVAARDRLSTRLYNYFAQPPVQAEFCAVAAEIGREVAETNPDAVLGRASDWLVRLDRPFQNFYGQYAQWQSDAADWDRRQGAVTLAALQP